MTPDSQPEQPEVPNGKLPKFLDTYDALLVDLDGTLLLADSVIEHAPVAMAAARNAGVRVLIVTNNASRSPEDVAGRLTARGIATAATEVVTSPQAAAAMLAADQEPGAPVLIIGSDALADAIADVGLRPVRTADSQPVAVAQGFSPEVGWRELAEGCLAIQAGATWVATNADTTLPTDRGILPGNGSLVAALQAATGRTPRVAGKPERPLLDAAIGRVGARRPLVIGDRLSTDIAAAARAGIDSLMVLTGVSDTNDVIHTDPKLRPTFVAADLRALTGEITVLTIAGRSERELAEALAELPR